MTLQSLLEHMGIETDLIEIEHHDGYTVITEEPEEGPEFDCS